MLPKEAFEILKCYYILLRYVNVFQYSLAVRAGNVFAYCECVCRDVLLVKFFECCFFKSLFLAS